MESGDEHEDDEKADKRFVRKEIERIRGFVAGLAMEDLRGGTWFPKLLAFALDNYAKEVDAEYFRRKYPNLPPDAIVDSRIQMAARYAGIEGGLSASAYTGAVAATIGSGGGASPLTLPAGGTAFVVDMSYTSYLQLRMAHDIAVLYGVPLDLNDPEDVWKLVRIAFAVKVGESGSSALVKFVPAVVRPAIKKIFSGSTLAAVKSLPVIGKYLLQRNIIKFAIPAAGIPLTVLVNYWLTRALGAGAKMTLRREVRIIETAEQLAASTELHEDLAWTMRLFAQTDGPMNEDERLLIHHTTTAAIAAGCSAGAFAGFRELVDMDEDAVWARIEALGEGRAGFYEAALVTAAIDGKIAKVEADALTRLADMCEVEYDAKAAEARARAWA